YRGCTHGCVYCDSRSTCYQMDHAFEDVAVKVNAPELLEEALRRRRRRCMVGTGSMSDPYLPLERETRLTRRCLEVIERQGFGVSVLTKSDLLLRDLDLLTRINQTAKAVVCTTFTTFDENLCRVLEPNVCTTRRRFEMLKTCHEAGIRTGVWLCPILPFLNDTEENLRGLLDCCFDAGVEAIVNFGMGVTLREGDREYFYAQLDRHFPGMKERYIRAFGNRYQCPSPNAPRLERIFREECRKRGVLWEAEAAMSWLMEFEDKQSGQQLNLFS
ncbi:MAG: radical SAM protein, partial [Oscillibacter sp.]|nr:radical SAM protein [Oscillibacter sp.]